MILLWGVSEDEPLRAVREQLSARGAEALFLDQFDAASLDCRITAHPALGGVLRIDARKVALEDIAAVYLRPYPGQRVVDLLEGDAALSDRVARFDDALMTWIELTAARVVNRPSAMASNASKPLQAHLAAAYGFEAPATLLTSDRRAAEAFRDQHGAAIYKSVSGVRSRVSRLTDDVLARLDAPACPLQLQAWIDGLDWRVHVVGDDIFACTVASPAVDYRYPGAEGSPVIASARLPAEIEARCVALARGLDFSLTGIDLRQGKDGRWIFFEANPSPGFTYYETATGAPIASAVATMLAA